MMLDSFAWMEYFQGTPKGKRVREILDGDRVLFTCPTVLAEVFSKYARSVGDEAARDRVAFILDRAVIVPATADTGIEAGRIHGEMKPKIAGFGLADAFVLAAAREKGARVLTGDPHFRGVADAEIM